MSPAEVSGALQFSPTSIMESAAGLSNSAKIKLKRLPSSEKDQTVRQVLNVCFWDYPIRAHCFQIAENFCRFSRNCANWLNSGRRLV